MLLAQSALAGMSLDKMILYLDDVPNARDDVVVSNPDREPLYLQTEIFRVDNPGQENERVVPITDPKDYKLLVSPTRAIIPPGSQKRFRLMSVERDLAQEAVYRVTFKPVVGDITTKATGVKILVAYQALIFVQPRDGAYQLELAKEGEEWKLRNSGNINVEIRKLEFCRAETRCESIPLSGRIYPGAYKTLKLPQGKGYLKLNAYDGKESSEERLPV
ncbi:P pilus assembly protein, chaperone PapD [Microbulbifer donghaiensis]|uniref:P pilus assembly protein, chaperone PapD n=2 Tax=Microbulbifer donghaiensis TaxID=494016 RepID=A0A1M5CM04_9GAMM|nr:P pilus assembly protein, chaperone PapD [Microbulbifer donghaiensis]